MIGMKLRLIAAAAMVALTAALAAAQDRVYLTDGRVVEGEIVRELDGMVWIRTPAGVVEFFGGSDVQRIQRGGEPAPAEDPSPSPEEPADRPRDPTQRPQTPEPASDPAAYLPRVAVITLGEGITSPRNTVGIYITAKALEDIIPLLEADGVTDVILRVASGGGLAMEVPRLNEVIENEFKPRFNTVAWIDSAISAAAMMVHSLPDIYMMPKGTYGACTAWFGALQGVKGRELEEYLAHMERISAWGGHHPYIMRHMQWADDAPLTATIDEFGDVHWFHGPGGDILVNPQGRILTFNSLDAERLRFSRGTAATHEELVKLMGYEEVVWVGRADRDTPWPVSRAEESMRRFRDRTYQDEQRLNEYWILYDANIQVARSRPVDERGPFVGQARQQLNRMKAMVANNPNWSFMAFGMMPDQWEEWVDQQERMLRDLMR